MNEQQLQELKYPIGQFLSPEKYEEELLDAWIDVIAAFPERLNSAVEKLSAQQLDTPYRPGGWTVRQVVHHCADSHMNAMIRFKLALTENQPVIKPYFEDRWAELADSREMEIGPAIGLLTGLHSKWVFLLKSLTAADLQKHYVHPEHQKGITLQKALAMYAWHCDHHLAHITNLALRNNWS